MSGPQNSYSQAKIGNWVEEQSLFGLTGTRTYEIPSKGVDDKTAARTIVHTDREEESEWQSTNRMPKPPRAKGLTLGGRAARRAAAARVKVAADMAAEAAAVEAAQRRGYFESSTQAAYMQRESSFSNIGKRVMKTQSGGAPQALDAGMYEFGLHERPPRLPRSVHESMVPETDYASDVPITFYTQALNKSSMYSSGGATKGRPFNRNTAFTNDIMDSRKFHAEAIDNAAGTNHSAALYGRAAAAPAAVLELADIFARVVVELTQDGSPNGLRTLSGLFTTGRIAPSTLAAALAARGIILSAVQQSNIARGLASSDGYVYFSDVRKAIGGRKLAGKRFELASGAFDILDAECLGEVAATAAPAFVASWGKQPGDSVTREEFLAYFEDAGIAMSDAQFERLIRAGWDVPRVDVRWREGRCMRVVATTRDGKEQVCAIRDGAGIKDTEWGRMRASLHRQGLHGVVSIQFKGRRMGF